jgi:hypothetical protein
MATTAQFEANHQNAQASTGPRTAEGKARSSQNAAKLGLFSKSSFVLMGERAEYDELYQSLWDRLRPLDALEGTFAVEVIRATWRNSASRPKVVCAPKLSPCKSNPIPSASPIHSRSAPASVPTSPHAWIWGKRRKLNRRRCVPPSSALTHPSVCPSI